MLFVDSHHYYMLMPHDKILDLPVQTQSGQDLGRVHSFDIEIDSQSIYKYYVKPTGVVNIFAKYLIISRGQVLDITKDKMIVDDAVYSRLAKEDSKQKNKAKLSTEIAISE